MIAFAPSLSMSSVSQSNIPTAHKKAVGVAKVLTKNGKFRTDNDPLEKMRSDVTRLVQGEEYVTGSKMLAYSNVGSAIGKSPSWVRKFVGRQEGVALQFLDFVNIARAYGALCDRIESAAATERKRADELGRMADEALESPFGLVEGPQGPDSR